MNKNALDRTFFILHDLRNLGPEHFSLKIRLVHQELQEAKQEDHESFVRALTPGFAGARLSS